MIVTVTLNPALDLFYNTHKIETDAVLRATAERRLAGGKGLNVSRMLNKLGVANRAILFAGGETGDEVVRLACEEGMTVERISVHTSTRINVVIEEASGRRVKINARGAAPDTYAIESLASIIERDATDMKALVLSGALPPGVLPGFYAQMIDYAKSQGIPTFIDSSGDGLAQAIPALPDVVKINREELGELFGNSLETAEEAVGAARELVREGIGRVCITMSAEGALLVGKDGVWSASVPQRSNVRAVGAGDAFMAGFVAAYVRGGDEAMMLRQAIACGSAWAVQSNDINGLMQSVSVRREQA